MKVRAIFFVLLLLGLCSCTGASRVKTSTEAPSDTETMSEETNAEDSTGDKPISIIFEGEIITAPGYYPGVPDAYASVLDDLFLYGEVYLRYNVLHYENRVTQEIIRESERIKGEIRSRRHLPYPGAGLGITGGYTLLDLDGDGNSELLILNDSSMPVIQSVFAIRNGQLVCIDNGSSELDRTTLTADGTFYQCIDWRNTGYADLTAFRLEAGMSEFTTIFEAHAALSFSDGDVPVPYWVKTENGDEISITEDEFNALLEQYKNPPERMALDFVPLHPDAVNPWSVPRHIDEPPTIPIDYPIAYQGAPEEYKPVLDALFLLEDRMGGDDYGSGHDLTMVGFGEYPYPRDSALGYALADLNSDGVLELLLGTVDGLNSSAPNSIFTLKDGQPVLLATFWSRSRGAVSADGTIYSAGSGGAGRTYLSSYRLDMNADTLTQLTDMHSDYLFIDSEEKSYFIQVIEGRNHYISKQEFFDFRETYESPPERMKLAVIPIVQ